MSTQTPDYHVLVIGGGHAGAEAAWAAANLLAPHGGRVALVTLDATKVGVMSCNPAIGGLAKGQMVRELDALGGLMPLVADATGIQFRTLNASRGPAVRGPRCQSDKHAYAREVRRLLSTRPNLDIVEGSVEELLVEGGRCVGARVATKRQSDEATELRTPRGSQQLVSDPFVTPSLRRFIACSTILTTGTFMRGLMHTGESRTPGGRVGEAAAVGISGTLRSLGFDLGRLKTGTPPRLQAGSIDFSALEEQPGDTPPEPFSDLSAAGDRLFPNLPQVSCWITHTDEQIHDLIRRNLHRAPMYNGQIETAGPRYCPSIEDKVVRFKDRTSHHVFIEPESLETDEIYCNGISTSLPADVQEEVVHALPGCENAKILRHGYAVEYDMVWPHQIDATGQTKRLPGLFLAGQINGTSGYEEAAGQGLIAGLNAARLALADSTHEEYKPIRLGRDQAYIGVLMDDLVTKTPREPYRMFTSRAEHRLLLRADNADSRLTPPGREWGLVDDERWRVYQAKQEIAGSARRWMGRERVDGKLVEQWVRQPSVALEDVEALMRERGIDLSRLVDAAKPPSPGLVRRALETVLAELQYEGYIERQRRAIADLAADEARPLPASLDYKDVTGLRGEAAAVLNKFRPATLGQAGRLAGVNPADLMVVSLACRDRDAQPV